MSAGAHVGSAVDWRLVRAVAKSKREVCCKCISESLQPVPCEVLVTISAPWGALLPVTAAV
jgi:hypothetical protein